MKIKNKKLVYTLLASLLVIACHQNAKSQSTTSELSPQSQPAHHEPNCQSFRTQIPKSPAGIACLANNAESLIDRGVYFQVTSAADGPSEVTFSTGASEYEAKIIIIKGVKLYYAVLDCDSENGPVYRPTSSCLSAVYRNNEGRFVYLNLVVEDHVNNKLYMSERAALEEAKAYINTHLKEGIDAP